MTRTPNNYKVIACLGKLTDISVESRLDSDKVG